MMENQDQIKSYVDQNREAFESHTAPQGVWERIELRLDKDTRWFSPKTVFLGFLVLILIALTVAWLSRPGEPTEEEEELLYASVPDFAETRDFYVREVFEEWNNLKKIHKDATLEEDLGLLDQIESELRAELMEAQDAYREQILHALIQNYQTKLSLLQKVKAEIEASESTKSIYHDL